MVSVELLGEELLGPELGVALLEELPLLESLEPDELGVADELEELGEVELGGVADDPDALDELGELGVAELLLLEESRGEPDIEPEGEDGEVLELLEPVAEPERDAPGPLALSQP